MRSQLNGLKELIDAVPAGPPGPPGPEGPVFASVSIGSVGTGAPGSPAAVEVSTSGNDVALSFTIPTGETGPKGDPGEVTQSALNSAIMGTAQNPTSISTLSLNISDPPTKAEVEAILGALNSLISALQRQP
jgi:hypothetical protein